MSESGQPTGPATEVHAHPVQATRIDRPSIRRVTRLLLPAAWMLSVGVAAGDPAGFHPAAPEVSAATPLPEASAPWLALVFAAALICLRSRNFR